MDYAESSAIATMLDSMGVEEFCMRYMVAIKQALFQVGLIFSNINDWSAGNSPILGVGNGVWNMFIGMCMCT